MKKLFLLLASIALSGCNPGTTGNGEPSQSLPRIAIAGLAIESSTFSPARSHADAFRAKRGDEVFSSYPFYAEDSPVMARADFFPALTGRAIPGGMVTREAYESLMQETLDRLQQNLPYDGLLFDIHGAMSVEGLDDPEGDIDHLFIITYSMLDRWAHSAFLEPTVRIELEQDDLFAEPAGAASADEA